MNPAVAPDVPSPAPHLRDRVPWVVAAGLLVTSVFAFEWVFAWGPLVPGGLDGPRMSLPHRYFLHAAVADGGLPLWNPMEVLGTPWLAQLAPGLLHPLNWIAAFVDPLRGYAWNHVLAVLFAAAGTFVLAASRGAGPGGALVAGAGFGASGVVVTQANLHYLVANATIPWVLWAGERVLAAPGPGRVLLAASMLSLVLFAGDPQGVLVAVAWLAVLAWVAPAERRAARLGRLSLVGIAALLVSTVQAWPTLEAMADGGRLALDLSGNTTRRLTPTRLVDVFFGLPGTASLGAAAAEWTGTRETPWIERPGLGPILFALAITGASVGRRARAELVLAGAFLWAALGAGTGLWDVLSRLPLWRSFQYAEKMLPYAALAISLCAGAGWRALVSSEGSRRRFSRIAGGAAAVAALTASALFAWPDLPYPAWNAATRSTWVAVAVVTALAALLVARKREGMLAPALLVLAIHVPALLLPHPTGYVKSADLARSAPWVAREAMRAHGLPHAPRILALESDPATGLRAPPAEVVAFGFALQFGLSAMIPYHPFPPPGPARICEGAGVDPVWCLRLTGVEFVSRPSTNGVSRGLTLLGTDPAGTIQLLRFERPIPRVRIVPRQERVKDFEAALTATRGLGSRIDDTVVVEEEGEPTGVGAAGDARIVGWTSDTMTVAARAEDRALLVLNEAWAPGWVARIDGEERPVLRVNAMARGVWLDGGEQLVEFSYEPLPVRAGASVSGLTVAVLLLLDLRRRRRGKLEPDSSPPP